jgi:hypothetical protein
MSPAAAERPTRRFAAPLVGVLGVWKLWEALVAETVAAAVSPSLYTLGFATFAATLFGPRRFQVIGFFAGATLCLAAIGFEARR